MDGKEFQIHNISSRNSLDFKAMDDNRFVKTLFDMLFLLLASAKNYSAYLIFSFDFNFIIYSQLVKEKGENERRLLQIHFSKRKKIRKENKTKTKIKRTSKRNALVLRTFKYENNDDRDLEEAHNPLPASEL